MQGKVAFVGGRDGETTVAVSCVQGGLFQPLVQPGAACGTNLRDPACRPGRTGRRAEARWAVSVAEGMAGSPYRRHRARSLRVPAPGRFCRDDPADPRPPQRHPEYLTRHVATAHLQPSVVPDGHLAQAAPLPARLRKIRGSVPGRAIRPASQRLPSQAGLFLAGPQARRMVPRPPASPPGCPLRDRKAGRPGHAERRARYQDRSRASTSISSRSSAKAPGSRT